MNTRDRASMAKTQLKNTGGNQCPDFPQEATSTGTQEKEEGGEGQFQPQTFQLQQAINTDS